MTMKAMLFQGLRVLLVTTGSLLMVASAHAQEKQKYFFKVPPGLAQYTQRHVLDVGDVPGHQVALGEMHYGKYTNEASVYDGVKVVEGWDRLQSDLVNGTGRVWSYRVYLLENADKIFARTEGVVQTTVAPDGAKKILATSVITLTGGTGKFKGIRGTLKATSSTDLKTGLGDVVQEGEYWIEN